MYYFKRNDLIELPYTDRAYAHYGPFRKVQYVGLKRAWFAAKADHHEDPNVPIMKPLDYMQYDGSYADKERSHEAINRWSHARQRYVLNEQKQRRMKLRQRDARLRQSQREYGV
jgi:hypothetical protein